MKWVRCPKCRTLNDVDRYPQCDGCSGSLEGLPPADSAPSPAARQTERDTRSASKIFWGIAVALLLGTFVLPAEVSIFTAIAAFLLIAALFIQLSARLIHRSGLPVVIQVLVGAFAVAASLFGSILLVAFACSGPMSRVRL